MSDLDEKLANIVETHGLQSYDTDATVEQIKQAFAEELERQDKHHPFGTPETTLPLQELVNQKQGYMTGQYWYDRFMRHYYDLVIYPDPNPLHLVKESEVYMAARRAAGLDTEGVGK